MRELLVAGAADRAGQVREQKPDRLGGERVGEQLVPGRVDRLHRMIEGANAGRDPQPIGRGKRQHRVVDDDRGLQPCIEHAALHARCFVGGAAGRRVLGRREGSWNGDMQERCLMTTRRHRLRPIEFAAGKRHVAAVEDRGDRDLAGVDRAAAAKAHHCARLEPAQFLGESPHGLHRHVLGNAFEHAGAACAERAGDLIKQA
jgi:hypothetical protein